RIALLHAETGYGQYYGESIGFFSFHLCSFASAQAWGQSSTSSRILRAWFSGLLGVEKTRIMQPPRRAYGQNNCPQTWARGPALRKRQPFPRAYLTASRMCLFGCSAIAPQRNMPNAMQAQEANPWDGLQRHYIDAQAASRPPPAAAAGSGGFLASE